MAGSLSINKRKTYAVDTPDVLAACPAKTRAVPRAAMALRSADAIAVGTFTVFGTFTVLPDDGRMDFPGGGSMAQDGRPRIDYNVAHCLGGTPS
jgi:hypothetical protein